VTWENGSEDILVLTPYNAQVRCLQDHLPDGTVDKFQGQEAQLNVAISRAHCRA
jgi:superfamily I DNA and/or RNA helicase